jgi:hypothetical protein
LREYNELHLIYMAWDSALSSDTDQTLFTNKVERLVVLEAAKILAGSVNEDALWTRIVNDIKMLNQDIESTQDNESDNVGQSIDWHSGYGDDGAFF